MPVNAVFNLPLKVQMIGLSFQNFSTMKNQVEDIVICLKLTEIVGMLQ